MNQKRLLIILGIGLAIGATLIAGLLLYRRNSSLIGRSETDSVQVIKDGNELTVRSNGNVTYKTAAGEFTDNWSAEKTDAFFDYFDDNYTGESETLFASQNQVVINKNGTNYYYSTSGNSSTDELIDAAIDDSQNQDGGDGGTGGDSDINQYFSPQPTATQPSEQATPTPTPYNGGSFSDTCLYWKLSYCVIPITPTPAPTTTSAPDPSLNVVDVPDCGEWVEGGNQQKTIISNTVCLPTPTPQ